MLVIGVIIFLYPDYREWKNQKEIQQITEQLVTEEGDDSKLQAKEKPDKGQETQVENKNLIPVKSSAQNTGYCLIGKIDHILYEPASVLT